MYLRNVISHDSLDCRKILSSRITLPTPEAGKVLGSISDLPRQIPSAHAARLSVIHELIGEGGAFGGEGIVSQKLRYFCCILDRRGATTVLPIGNGVSIAADNFGGIPLSDTQVHPTPAYSIAKT
jgi:hypothetical protein